MAEQTNDDRELPAVRGVSFGHVGLAVNRPTDLWPVLAGSLGGRHAGSGSSEGYGWTHLRFANGFIVEGLHPEPDDESGFLERFLDRSGVGPHHLTFFVEDLDDALAVASSHGFTPVVERRDDPDWLEAVLHPREACGIVVQLVQSSGERFAATEAPEGFPDLGFDHPVASLGRVVHAVADLEGSLRLFRSMLGGRVVSSGSAVDGNHWVELGWDGPGRLRLLEGAHADIHDWIDGRQGRLRHLFFSFDEPSHVPGARQVAPGRWVVDPDDVLGTRFVIASSAR